ncbi:GntR family transcriptional regulator [Streptomyces sp. SL13]|jgi:DNA-binding GntR family transcriptional regulator|uniref:GntR family transcriptional regulator n=1 Tax=Streptantibioticus silvisoli TaxID=2705255 RepID=A0AA90HCJ1_9ACTN|nr:GntR family transcriptional regulator [Streptantibioticus silvisoli]MDI5962148.1 GntR family transcriptional regulator [Streptantibioticus silvisoli]MDI5972412.1 GntR family transcriptional regulator [Streptantibioticus silvisoli]
MTAAPLPKARLRGLAQEAADLVREAIFAGHFPPGSPLREVELAAALGVSRGSVREGLALLEREGLVRSVWHRGTTVVDITAQDVEEVYAVRAALDRLAATSARRTASEGQLAELDDLVGAMSAEIAGEASGPRLLALDIAFHDRIYDAAGNRRLSDAWQAVRSQVHLFQLRRVALGYQHYRARVVDEHRELAALLRSGDPATLARRAEEHVHSACRSLLAGLGG